MKKYVITYDIGTTGIKTCLIEIEDTMRILASATAGYNLYVDDETGVKEELSKTQTNGGLQCVQLQEPCLTKCLLSKKSRLKVSASVPLCKVLSLLTRKESA